MRFTFFIFSLLKWFSLISRPIRLLHLGILQRLQFSPDVLPETFRHAFQSKGSVIDFFRISLLSLFLIDPSK